MAKPRGLGKGLDVLFQQKISLDEKETPESPYREIDIHLLDKNPHQPRKTFSEDSIEELAESIASNGLIQPIVVRPSPHASDRYQIVAGERRYEACKRAGLSTVKVIVTEISDEEALIIGLIENLQREDLNCIEEAEAYNRLRQSLGITQEELAKQIGKSRSHVANTLRLLSLQDPIKDALKEGTITPGHARALLSISDNSARERAFSYIIKKGLSVREAERIAEHFRKKGRLPAPVSGEKKRGRTSEEFLRMGRELKERFQEKIGVKVSLSGTLDKGKISLFFESQQELELLLMRLYSLCEEEGEIVSRETQEEIDADTDTLPI